MMMCGIAIRTKTMSVTKFCSLKKITTYALIITTTKLFILAILHKNLENLKSDSMEFGQLKNVFFHLKKKKL
jgi:hypothetical protein